MRKSAAWEVEAEKLEVVLRAGMAASSAENQRSWGFYIVRNCEKLETLPQISRYAGPVAVASSAIVVVCDPADKRFAEAAPIDMVICTEYLWFDTISGGFGGVWIGVYPFEDHMKSVSRTLGIPTGQLVFSVLPLDYFAGEKAPEDRSDPACIHEVQAKIYEAIRSKTTSTYGIYKYRV